MEFNLKEYNNNYNKLQKVLTKYQLRHSAKCGTPLVMSFLVTNRCFLKCRHCFYHNSISSDISKKSDKELSIDEYEKVSKSMEWFMTGIFCGGEPFIREDFHEIIYIFQKNNRMLLADSATNGQLTDSIVRQVEHIVSKNKVQSYSLGFSIDGFEEQHDYIRGSGTYKRLMETWIECKKIAKKYSNFELYICTAINNLNMYTMPQFIKWCYKELNPSKVSLIKVREKPRDGIYLTNVDEIQYKNSMDVITSKIKNDEFNQINRPQTYILPCIYENVYNTLVSKRRSFTCYAGTHGGFIDYDGTVSLCEIMPPIGNLREYNYDFLKLWNCEYAKQIRLEVNNCEECKNCTHESEGLLPSIYFMPNELKPFAKLEFKGVEL